MEEIPASWIFAAAVTVTLVSLVFIIWFFTFPSDAPPDEMMLSGSRGPFVSNYSAPNQDNRPYIIRVLRYDVSNQTYRFTDHMRPFNETEPLIIDNSYNIPLPDDNGPAAPAMVQVMREGEKERTIEQTLFILPVDEVQNIINRYSLYGVSNPVPSPTQPVQPTLPIPTAASEMVIPIAEYVCNNNDNTCTAHFSYISRADSNVSVPLGPKNYFNLPPENRGQPDIFYPGYQYDVLTVVWPANSIPIVWHLNGEEALAEPASPLQPVILADPKEGFIPLTVVFTAGTTGNEDTPLSYQWDLGDGTTSTTRDLIHTYKLPGKYTITCTITNQCETVYASSSVQAYNAAFSWEPDPGNPLSIRFFDQTTGTPDTWFWEFGNQDVTSFEKNPVHAFPAPGAYPIALTVHTGQVAKKIVNIVLAG